MNTETEIKPKTRADIANSLNKPPLKSGIRARNGKSYLLISYVEKGLDLIFGPLGWQTRNFTHSTVVNEEVGSVELWVRDPESNEWIVRIGAGAVLIQTKAGSGVLDVGSKITNCMEAAMGHLLADCTKNAAMKFGKHLGRDLSRKIEDVETYSALIQEYSEKFRSAISSLTSHEDVKTAYGTLPPSIRQFDEIQEVYKAKQRDLERMHLKQENP
jgi:hypothetical protein